MPVCVFMWAVWLMMWCRYCAAQRSLAQLPELEAGFPPAATNYFVRERQLRNPRKSSGDCATFGLQPIVGE
jgi:hypothetical protein